MEITIATLEDVTGIAKVHVETWQKYYRGQVPDFYLDSLSVEKRVHKLEEMLASGESETISLVAKENGRVIGFCDVGPSRDKDATAKTGELYAIYVLPGEMGRGVGSQPFGCLSQTERPGGSINKEGGQKMGQPRLPQRMDLAMTRLDIISDWDFHL